MDAEVGSADASARVGSPSPHAAADRRARGVVSASARPRITGGTARGRVLPHAVPTGVRPTAGRVREALFDLLGHDQRGRRWLDMTAGAGLVALEAWSRGADVVALERDRRASTLLKEVVAAWGATIDVRADDALRCAPSLGRFDVVFVDPAYDEDPVRLGVVGAAIGDIVVLEVGDASRLPETLGAHQRVDLRRYGGTHLGLYGQFRDAG